ncbi:formylglycine-generating enzyme family protein [Rhodoferax sp. GW822-FHT02A01]|uniref:formylglycine-generating enzyme family protein n=1 Tax=Rhodoferax sp. GW822-FHT02A01 TaxID=3141537 RepID=UPI00315D707B
MLALTLARHLTCVVSLVCMSTQYGLAEPVDVPYLDVPAGSIVSVLSGGSSDNGPTPVAAFFMRAQPVTVAQFQHFLETHPEWSRAQVPAVFADGNYLHSHDAAAGQLPQQAITNVSWFAAQAFCESEQARLPTWYEWEYVAAADESHADARKDPAWRARILGWYSQPASHRQLQVGSTPNYYGVQDMHGLIWEWVEDFNALLVSADSRNQGDPDQLQYCGAGAISLQDRENFAILMRVALLSSLGGSDSTNDLGFRCARSPLK